jgi:hypothetical protein
MQVPHNVDKGVRFKEYNKKEKKKLKNDINNNKH